MDFSETGVLPETFVAFTLFSNKHAATAAFLGLTGNSNMASMAAIAHCVCMVADPRLGTSTCV
jgi:hypothetical protein